MFDTCSWHSLSYIGTQFFVHSLIYLFIKYLDMMFYVVGS